VTSAAILRAQIETTLANRIPGALTVRPAMAPATISFGIEALDQKSIGIPRGYLSEICGPASSGRTTLLLSLMRQVTAAGECCALIDSANSLDPHSASANGVDLKRLLWVKCGRRHGHVKLTPVDKALKAADLIINAGGFGLIVLDLADIEPSLARRIPLASWFRFRRAVESTSSAFVVLEQVASAKSCASLVLTLQTSASEWVPTREQHDPLLLMGTNFIADVTRSRIEPTQRKPPAHAMTAFRAVAAWAT
jgi:recombination protein RecA